MTSIVLRNSAWRRGAGAGVARRAGGILSRGGVALAILLGIGAAAPAVSQPAGDAEAEAASGPAPDLSYVVVDGRSAPDPLSEVTPSVERGESLFADPETGGCAACHAVSGVAPPPSQAGPRLDGVGARLSASAIRLWIINPRVFVEDSAMPAYYSLSPADATPGAPADAPPRTEPRLDGASIEDLVAYLESLK